MRFKKAKPATANEVAHIAVRLMREGKGLEAKAEVTKYIDSSISSRGMTLRESKMRHAGFKRIWNGGPDADTLTYRGKSARDLQKLMQGRSA